MCSFACIAPRKIFTNLNTKSDTISDGMFGGMRILYLPYAQQCKTMFHVKIRQMEFTSNLSMTVTCDIQSFAGVTRNKTTTSISGVAVRTRKGT